MKKIFLLTISIVLSSSFITSASNPKVSNDVFNKLRLMENDIPEGFTYGKIPDYAKQIFKDNPWVLDKAAIKRLGGSIYPGGDYKTFESVHVTIVSKAARPFGDDLVCFIIVYKDAHVAQKEFDKLNTFVGFNGDRATSITDKNIAVYLHVDDTANFHLLRNITENLQNKMSTLQ
jgi:hypothetical protein